MRAQTTTALLLCWLAASVASASTDAPQTADSPSARARRFFESLGAGEAARTLGMLRPAALSPEARREVLAGLPTQGALEPDAKEAAKLSDLEEILNYHERDQVFETILIDAPQAFVGLHARAVLLISRPALRILSSAELQALVAHEVGHEYFWADYDRARLDPAALQEIELKCDVIAVLTLVELGLEPSSLDSATSKATRFNERLGAATNSGDYPGLQERRQFVRAIARSLPPPDPARRALRRRGGRSAGETTNRALPGLL